MDVKDEFKKLSKTEQRQIHNKIYIKLLKHWEFYVAALILLVFRSVGKMLGENYNFYFGSMNLGLMFGIGIGLYLMWTIVNRRWDINLKNELDLMRSE